MGGHAKDEESARRAAAAMGWFDESYHWTPENPAPPELMKHVHDRWVAVPKIEDVAAPTLSEIQAAMENDDNVLTVGDWSVTPPDLTYVYEPPAPFFEEGVTKGWVTLWDGSPGPARTVEVRVIADGEGNAWVEPTGEWQDTTVVDDA